MVERLVNVQHDFSGQFRTVEEGQGRKLTNTK
jgi:hypothetical protein